MLCFHICDIDFQAATFAVGNAAYHTGDLYGQLIPAIPPLVQLLSDQMMRTRTNAAGKRDNSEITHGPPSLQPLLFDTYDP